MEKPNVLSFIHISDIHFAKYSSDAYDIDNELREAMITDLANYVKNSFKITGILVCGDIAYSGKKEEYDKALDFLHEVIDICELKDDDLFCVPGNHDVDQSVSRKSLLLDLAQTHLETIDKTEHIDDQIRKIQNDSIVNVSTGLLYKPIEMYNHFFSKFSCSYTVDNPNWITEIPINSKYTLGIYGMNSTLISSYKDHLDENGNKRCDGKERKMLINRKQIPNVKNDLIYLSLCHHPPECWSDPKLEELMDERVRIQLYGHKHIQNIDTNGKRVRISSGALHPERGDDWVPRYNLLELWIDNDILYVKIHPRIFDDIKGKFICDSKSCDKEKDFQLCCMELLIENTRGDFEEMQQDEKQVRKTSVRTKEIVYRFSVLSDRDKDRIISKFRSIKYSKEQNIEILLDQLAQNRLEEEFLNTIKS